MYTGNSLFAEVEDRRQNIMNKMNVLREKYTELKRIYKSQTAELKMLKAERVATFRKWENDTNYISTENEELFQKYKNRISDLESRLKCEIKKNDSKQLDRSDTSFGYKMNYIYIYINKILALNNVHLSFSFLFLYHILFLILFFFFFHFFITN